MEIYIQIFLLNAPQIKSFSVSFKWIPFVVIEFFQHEDLADIDSAVFH